MGNSTLRLIAVSIVRGLAGMAGAWFVRKGFVDHSLMQKGAEIVAFFVVDRTWEFWMIHRRELKIALYQRWLVLLGLKSEPYVQPSTIVEAARARVREGLHP